MLHGTIISHRSAPRTILLARFCSTAPIAFSLATHRQQSVRSGKRTVLYQFYQSYADALAPFQGMATAFGHTIGRGWPGLPETPAQRGIAAACELFAQGRLQHHRPEFSIDAVTVGNRSVAVREEKTWVRPFATLLHFAKDTHQPQPKVLLVAPMSGHFATLLRGTVKTMLP